MKLKERILRWYYFHLANPVVREGETEAFKWKFRRFWLEIETRSGNWKARWTADQHPYGYLLAGKDDKNIEGFAMLMYQLGSLFTSDQRLVNDCQNALKRCYTRIANRAVVTEDEAEEKAALEFEKGVQEFKELPKMERRKEEKRIDKRFKKAMARELQAKEQKEK